MAVYTYNPLKEPKAVRFVRLLPGTAGGVHCQLFRASLNDKISYSALSYAWGSTKMTQTITCNGRKLPVTESLMSALLRLRLPEEPRVLWADAICIQQDDVNERNRQVALIPEIYQKAAQLLVWLGPGDRYSALAMKLMEVFASAQQELDSRGRLQHLYVKPEEWLAWSKFLQRGWFERMWVIQELAMGLKMSGDAATLFLCGRFSFGLEVLRDACEWCNALTIDADLSTDEGVVWKEVQSGVKRVLVLCDMTKYPTPDEVRAGTWRRWLLSKVAATRERKATDPRDRLFALYGFLQDGDHNVAVADYSKTTARVYHDFAYDYVMQSNCLDVLSEVEEPGMRGMKHIPSWVPDWSSVTARTPLLRLANLLAVHQPRKLAYQAFGMTEVHDASSIFSPREDVLLLDAVCFDEVSWVSEVLSQDTLASSENAQAPLLRLWSDVVSHHDPYPTGIPAIEAFYKTLICGREEEDRHLENFVALWKSLHGDDGGDLETFCIGTPEMIQLLCRKSYGAEMVAQIHDAKGAIDAMHLDTPVPATSAADSFFTALEMQNMPSGAHTPRSGQHRAHLRHANAQRYRSLLLETMQNRVLFQTKKGYIGLGVHGTEHGDIVSVLVGGKTPYVLRKTPVKEKLTYKAPRSKASSLKTHTLSASLVGEAYVHGIMYGEALRREDETQWDRIALA